MRPPFLPSTTGTFCAALATLSLMSVVALEAAAAKRAMQRTQPCWTPSQLAVGKGDAKVFQNVLRAYREPPSIDRQGRPAPKNSRPTDPRFHRKALRRVDLPKNQKVVALTFDIGEQPHEIAGYQGSIIDFLRAQRVPATVFVGGKWMLSHVERTKQLIADPLFELANHGWGHRNLRTIPYRAQMRSIETAQITYENIWSSMSDAPCYFDNPDLALNARAEPRMQLYRFPFGACTRQSLELVSKLDLMSIQWDVSSGDPSPQLTAEQMTRHVVNSVRPGSIVLFHANGRGYQTPRAIPQIVKRLKARGYRFATVSGLLSIKGAKPDLRDICYDSTPGDTNRYDRRGHSLNARFDRFIASARRRLGKRSARSTTSITATSKRDARQPQARPRNLGGGVPALPQRNNRR